MNREIRNCQNCKTNFEIDASDFKFYERIKVPPPTWCPECRIVRRMSVQNQRALYKRKCDLCGNEMVTFFSPEARDTVYCQKCWWSDNWDPFQYGLEYDFSKPFFAQFRELLDRVPWSALQTVYTTMVNSEYCNIASYLKDCYLMFNSDYSEDCYYGTYVERSKRSFDLYMADYAEICYESNNLEKCYHVFYSSNCNNCIDVYFSRNLRGCSKCFGCVNLSNKQYYIFNEPYSKEEYFRKLKQFDLGSRKTVLELRQQMADFNLKFPRKFAEGFKNLNVSGDYVFNSKNTYLSYEMAESEDCKFCQFLFIETAKNCQDVTMWGGGLTNSYDSMGIGGGADQIKFSFDCWANLMNIEYCFDLLVMNSDLFGCSRLKNKKFCILNRQYSEKEYNDLIPKIKKQMDEVPYIDKKGRVYKYGEFFPPEIHSFAYNETIAQEYFPLTKEEAIDQGFRWKDAQDKNYQITISSDQLADNIKEVEDGILGQIIGCEHFGKCKDQCSVAFKITPRELEFYRAENIPVPRLCSNCRHYERLRNNNPMRFYHRRCGCEGLQSVKSKAQNSYQNVAQHFHGGDHCPNEFETTYAPERREIIYCEECYQQEII